MFGKFNRLFGISIIILTLLILIPSSFALNETDIVDSTSLDNDVLQGPYDYADIDADFYFNSSNEEIGDGSIDNPYRDLKTSRIKDYSTVHLANGEYTLPYGKTVKNVTIIGENPQTTIIRCTSNDTGIFSVKNDNYLFLRNVTLIGFNIDVDGAYVFAKNTIFKDSVAPYEESDVSEVVNSALNSRGGAIYGYNGKYRIYPKIYIENCTFINNTAEYGGAIFADDAIVIISNSSFIDNHAYSFGGSLVFSHDTLASINDTLVMNSKSEIDAGGAIYLYSSDLLSNNLTVINCSATFGGAVTSLNSTLNLTNFTAIGNTAIYDGGAIYLMYQNIAVRDSEFINNSARNGGAIFSDDASNFELAYTNFKDNYGRMVSNSVYMLCNHLSITENNNFTRNKTKYTEDIYVTNKISWVIGNNNYTLYYNNSTFDGVLPSRYSLADHGYVTPIRDQQEGGNCWAFAALAALESAILKASGESLDLSEGNMKNVIELFSDYGRNEETNEGGTSEYSLAYLTSWLGPVYESQDKYDDYNALSPIFNSTMHVQNVIFITRNNYTDNNAIKRAIMKYGAVGSVIYFDNDYYSDSKYSYYYSGYPTSNHAIVIVGWDDDYSQHNFEDTPPGNGAWIAKNSWNTDWGDDGYFYISYYDTSVARLDNKKPCYVFVFNDTEKYDKNYQYDIIGVTDYYMPSRNVIWVANVFNATDDELLAAVSTTFRKSTDYELSIYVNDALKYTSSGTCQPGYTTINLGGYVPLKAGDKFKVVFKLTGDDVEFAISENMTMNKISYGPGMSFVSKDGVTWQDLYDFKEENFLEGHAYSSQVACIKAFTVLYNPDSNLDLKLIATNDNNDVKITATLYKGKYPIAYSGKVTINVNGKDYNVQLKNSKAVLPLTLKNVGSYKITATYNGLKANTTVKVTKLNLNLNSRLIVGQDSVLIKLSSSTVSNAPVMISLVNLDFPSDNKNYSITLKNGKYDLNLKDLNYGNYTVHISAVKGNYESHFDYDFKITVKKTKIKVKSAFSYCDFEDKLTVQLTDSHGMPLYDFEVIIEVGNQAPVGITDENGFASVNIRLSKIGKYAGIVYFLGGSGYSSTSAKFNIEVRPTVVFPASTYLTKSKYNAILLDRDANPLANAAVSVTLDGVEREVRTDSNGKITIPLNLKTGKHTITIYNTQTWEERSQTINIVNRIMGNKNMNVYYLSGSSYKVRVYGDDGKPASGVYLKISVNKKTNNVKTNSKGYASFKISLSPKTYTITACYKGYKVSNKIVVKPVLTAKSISKKKSKFIRFSAKLVNSKGKALKGKSITFNVKGKRYVAKTNKKGIATINLIDLKVGKYPVTVKYGKSTVRNMILIRR